MRGTQKKLALNEGGWTRLEVVTVRGAGKAQETDRTVDEKDQTRPVPCTRHYVIICNIEELYVRARAHTHLPNAFEI